MYDPTYEDQNEIFLAKLREVCDTEIPQIIGGDFNMARSTDDKNNCVVDFGWCDKFNS
jgi:hypothetical protein